MISGSALRSSTSWDIDSIILAGGEEKERWTSQKIETYLQYMAELKIYFFSCYAWWQFGGANLKYIS